MREQDDYAYRAIVEIPAQFEWLRTENKLLENKSSYYSVVLELYELLVNAIIRPPRFNYEERLLGPSSFQFCGSRYHRWDMTLLSSRGERLCCSHWKPMDAAHPFQPCIVFMHANSASRIQAVHYLSLVLSIGASLFA